MTHVFLFYISPRDGSITTVFATPTGNPGTGNKLPAKGHWNPCGAGETPAIPLPVLEKKPWCYLER